MEILSIGTVVVLKTSEQKLMIISRTPLYDNNGIVGYYDYGACLYPWGLNDSRQYFFNQENIKEICFQGCIDENELEYRKNMKIK